MVPAKHDLVRDLYVSAKSEVTEVITKFWTASKLCCINQIKIAATYLQKLHLQPA
jgi:hypothetical protein